MTVSVVDYGVGNLGSVVNMFRRIGTDVRLVSSASEIAASERVLLPGVGAFDHGVRRLREDGLIDSLKDFAATGRPMLGICLGMQLLFESSEEGDEAGLAVLPGSSVKFKSTPNLRIPHMGWNSLKAKEGDPLLGDVGENSRFYFVHSYRVVPKDEDHILATTPYGGSFVSMVRSGSIYGAQFHPEKSHAFGMTILRNFAAL